MGMTAPPVAGSRTVAVPETFDVSGVLGVGRRSHSQSTVVASALEAGRGGPVVESSFESTFGSDCEGGSCEESDWGETGEKRQERRVAMHRGVTAGHVTCWRSVPDRRWNMDVTSPMRCPSPMIVSNTVIIVIV